MSANSDEIAVSASDLTKEIRAIEQSVEEASARVMSSIASANAAVSDLETRAAAKAKNSKSADEGLEGRLAQARRNAARVQKEGEAEFKAFLKKTDDALNKLRRRLKLVEEKLASRH